MNAFDTADNDILLQELYHYDICGCAYSWFQSYPAYNIQFVTFHGSKSKSPREKSNVVSHKAEHSDRYCFLYMSSYFLTYIIYKGLNHGSLGYWSQNPEAIADV